MPLIGCFSFLLSLHTPLCFSQGAALGIGGSAGEEKSCHFTVEVFRTIPVILGQYSLYAATILAPKSAYQYESKYSLKEMANQLGLGDEQTLARELLQQARVKLIATRCPPGFH